MNPHRSDAEELIAKVPVIEVKGSLATCNGGGGALGHPIESARGVPPVSTPVGTVGLAQSNRITCPAAQVHHFGQAR